MSGESRLRQIYEFRTIGGVSNNPSITEHNKFHVWNNTTGVFDYTCIGEGHIDEDYFITFITNIINDISISDKYLSSISKMSNNYGQFTVTNGDVLYLELGALAWEDTVEATLTLPGDTKVLFDEADNLSGSANFTYNYTLNRLQLDSTPLMFKTGTESFKEGLKYLGNYSFSIGNSSISLEGGSYNFTVGYRAGQTLSTSSARNVIIGSYAGESIGSNVTDNILIGPYAGRFESSNSKFYLDNQNYGDAATGTNSSFLYADLETERRLYIRDRLSVEKEGKFGTSGLTDVNGEYGMYQMSAATGGNPQWHDGSVWQDFANSTNTYLNNVTYATGSLTFTLSDASTIGPIDISDVNTNVFATSPSSPATGKVTSDYGYIQISNTTFTNNEGFTFNSNLKISSNNLYIPGSLVLTTGSSAGNNSIFSDGTHGYITLGGVDYQIDNNPLEEYFGINIGGGSYEVFKQINEDNQFEFRTFRSTPIGIDNPNDRIKFSYSSDGDVIFIGTTAERNRLSTTIDNPITDVQIEKDNEGETLHIRALREGTGVTLTETDNYILIDATGAGGGEVNTMINIGTGEGVYYQKNGAQFELKSLTAADARLSWASTLTEIDLDLDLTVTGYTTPLVSTAVSNDTVFHQVSTPDGNAPTIEFKRLISDTITFTTTANNELRLEYGSAATASGINIGAGAREVYKTGTAPNFEFRTFASTGNHISLGYNGDLIEVDVDDITLTDLGTGVYSITQDVVDSFTFTQKAFTEGYAVSLDNSTNTNLIEIGVSELIPQFSFTTTPVYVAGLLEFKANYSNDIVNTALAATTLFEINIGDGLVYTPATNTLSTNQANVGTGTDYALRRAEMIADTASTRAYRLYVEDPLGTTVEDFFTLEIPKYQLPEASYTSTGILGGVTIKQNSFVWENSTQNYLTIDEVTGELDFPYEVVTYNTQNKLHDYENISAGALAINTKRGVARANIGAAYVNGSLTEDFNAEDLNVDDILSALNIGVTHQVGGIQIANTTVTSDGISLVLQQENGSKVTMLPGAVNVTLANTVSPTFNVFRHDGQRMLKLDVSTGDLYVYGSIRAGGTIEMFDTDAQNI